MQRKDIGEHPRFRKLQAIQEILNKFPAMCLINNLLTEGPAGYSVQQKWLKGPSIVVIALESLENKLSEKAISEALYEGFRYYIGNNANKEECNTIANLILKTDLNLSNQADIAQS